MDTDAVQPAKNRRTGTRRRWHSCSDTELEECQRALANAQSELRNLHARIATLETQLLAAAAAEDTGTAARLPPLPFPFPPAEEPWPVSPSPPVRCAGVCGLAGPSACPSPPAEADFQ